MDFLKKNWILVVGAVVVVLVLGYFGRHKIKSMLGMNATTPVVQETTPSTNSAVPSNNI